ncbi:MAG TPA: VanZ family protein [Streptosporangiaceae bacterium]|jgi:hypothetical protein
MEIKAALFCVALSLVGLLVWRVLVRWCGLRSAPALLLCLSAAVCLALTVPQAVAYGAPARLGQCLAHPAADLTYSIRIFGTRGLEDLMNVLLWVPPGLFGVLATRRFWYVVGGISVTMIVVELLQTIDPGRECDPGDWVYNTVGGLIGAVLGTLLIFVYERVRGRFRPTGRSGTAPPVRSGTVR